jgi:protein tyrosine phosphatase
MDRDRVRREYRELSLQTQRLRAARDSELHPSAVHPLNKNKNRYPDVLPVEETRIRLSKVGEIPHSDYINANLVSSDEKFSAICCQAPLPHTFDDFWRMVWEQVRCGHPFSSPVNQIRPFSRQIFYLRCHQFSQLANRD